MSKVLENLSLNTRKSILEYPFKMRLYRAYKSPKFIKFKKKIKGAMRHFGAKMSLKKGGKKARFVIVLAYHILFFSIFLSLF